MLIDELPVLWTADERIEVVTQMLGSIQLDIPAGRYGAAGRPNVTSVLYVLQAAREVLNKYRDELAAVLAGPQSPPPPPLTSTSTNQQPPAKEEEP